jgi:hypothetical protein
MPVLVHILGPVTESRLNHTIYAAFMLFVYFAMIPMVQKSNYLISDIVAYQLTHQYQFFTQLILINVIFKITINYIRGQEVY